MEFTDTQFMSAAEKASVLKAWERFLKGGCKKEQFTKALYHHLIQHCSFIAHYDIWGFYATYFENGDDTARFLSQFDIRNATCAEPSGDPIFMPESIEYGGRNWSLPDYRDINKAMVVVAAKYIPTLVGQANSKQKYEDIELAKRLLGKHGIAVKGL